jgi:hypothetical protein
MIPRDKAVDLIIDFKQGNKPIHEAKENALITVKNILENKTYITDEWQKSKYITYWSDVKQFIEKL